jgi:hypothetical protein
MRTGLWGEHHPQTGSPEEVGVGDGQGYNVNVELPAGSGDRAYGLAMREVVAPILEQFDPGLIVGCCGQDASAFDPNGRQNVSMDGFRSIGRVVGDAARSLCDGRLVLVQEGGYARTYAAFCLHATLEGVLGLDEPLLEETLAYMPDDFTRARESVEAVQSALTRYWRFSGRRRRAAGAKGASTRGNAAWGGLQFGFRPPVERNPRQARLSFHSHRDRVLRGTKHSPARASPSLRRPEPTALPRRPDHQLPHAPHGPVPGDGGERAGEALEPALSPVVGEAHHPAALHEQQQLAGLEADAAVPAVPQAAGDGGGFDSSGDQQQVVPVEGRLASEVDVHAALLRRADRAGDALREQVVDRDVVLVAREVDGEPQPADQQGQRHAHRGESTSHCLEYRRPYVAAEPAKQVTGGRN